MSHIVAVDGSQLSDLAFKFAMTKTEKNDKITIVHGFSRNHEASDLVVGITPNSFAEEQLRKDSNTLLSKYQQKCKGSVSD
jgi:hypothetical protein